MTQGGVGLFKVRAYILLAPLFALVAGCDSGGSGASAASTVAERPAQMQPPPEEPPPEEPPPEEPPPEEPPPEELDPTVILPLGDSITQGNTQNNSYRRPLWHTLVDAGYSVDFVGSLTRNNGGPPPNADFDLDHEGHWGWRADQLLASLPGWLGGYTPDIVMMHVGSNDAFQGQSTASTVAEIESIIDALRVDNRNVTILLAQLIPAADSGRNRRVNEFNAEVPGIVSRKTQIQSPVILVDQNSGFLLSDLRDGVHPTLAGQQKMAAKWFETLETVLSASDTTTLTISSVASLGSPTEVTGVFDESFAKQSQLAEEPPGEEEQLMVQEEVPTGWEPPSVEEVLTYYLKRVPPIEGHQEGQLTGRSINNHGHVSGTFSFLDSGVPTSLGFVWFGGEEAADANQLINPMDPMRETTVITDVMQINDEYYMAGLAEDPTVRNRQGQLAAFSFAFNGDTGRLHWLTDALIWPHMAPDGRVVSEDAGDKVFIWDGVSVYRWADPNDYSVWIDLNETCTVTVFDDRGLVHDFGTTENACRARYEHLVMINPNAYSRFFHIIAGYQRFSLWLNDVIDMNERGQLLIDGCVEGEERALEEAWDCGTFVLTPTTH